MNNICPQCQSAYSVEALRQRVGDEWDCRKCGAKLVVRPDGLALADEIPPIPARENESRPLPKRSAWPRNAAQWWEWLTPRAPGLSFGIGAVLVLFVLFRPALDQARILSAQVDLESGDIVQKQLDEELRENKDATDEDKEDRKLGQEKWKKDRRRLEKRLNTMRADSVYGTWWYHQWMRLGFLLLALGSLGFVRADQPPTRRVIGAIVLVTLLLLAFNSFAHYGIRFELGPTGGD